MALSLSVRQTESYVQGLINPEAKQKKEDKKPTQPEDPNVREAQDRLQRTLGLKVRIEDKKGKGRVIIEYSGLEDFDSILTALGGESILDNNASITDTLKTRSRTPGDCKCAHDRTNFICPHSVTNCSLSPPPPKPPPAPSSAPATSST